MPSVFRVRPASVTTGADSTPSSDAAAAPVRPSSSNVKRPGVTSVAPQPRAQSAAPRRDSSSYRDDYAQAVDEDVGHGYIRKRRHSQTLKCELPYATIIDPPPTIGMSTLMEIARRRREIQAALRITTKQEVIEREAVHRQWLTEVALLGHTTLWPLCGARQRQKLSYHAIGDHIRLSQRLLCESVEYFSRLRVRLEEADRHDEIARATRALAERRREQERLLHEAMKEQAAEEAVHRWALKLKADDAKREAATTSWMDLKLAGMHSIVQEEARAFFEIRELDARARLAVATRNDLGAPRLVSSAHKALCAMVRLKDVSCGFRARLQAGRQWNRLLFQQRQAGEAWLPWHHKGQVEVYAAASLGIHEHVAQGQLWAEWTMDRREALVQLALATKQLDLIEGRRRMDAVGKELFTNGRRHANLLEQHAQMARDAVMEPAFGGLRMAASECATRAHRYLGETSVVVYSMEPVARMCIERDRYRFIDALQTLRRVGAGAIVRQSLRKQHRAPEMPTIEVDGADAMGRNEQPAMIPDGKGGLKPNPLAILAAGTFGAFTASVYEGDGNATTYGTAPMDATGYDGTMSPAESSTLSESGSIRFVGTPRWI